MIESHRMYQRRTGPYPHLAYPVRQAEQRLPKKGCGYAGVRRAPLLQENAAQGHSTKWYFGDPFVVLSHYTLLSRILQVKNEKNHAAPRKKDTAAGFPPLSSTFPRLLCRNTSQFCKKRRKTCRTPERPPPLPRRPALVECENEIFTLFNYHKMLTELPVMLLRRANRSFCNCVCRGGPRPPWVRRRFPWAAKGRPYRKEKISFSSSSRGAHCAPLRSARNRCGSPQHRHNSTSIY